jgi:outer membrane protein assembly factor BamB
MQKKLAFASILTFVLALVSRGGEPTPSTPTYWQAWRGPLATGEAPDADPPVTWSETTNVRWKVAVPGRGHASPVVWGDLVFVVTAVPTDRVAETPPSSVEVPERMRDMLVSSSKIQRFVVLAYQRKDGAVRWERTLGEAAPHQGTHRDGSWASASPVTDGKHLFVSFGSQGLFCLDMEGKTVWSKDLGDMTVKMNFGEGSSPALCGETVIVNWDHEGASFITALSKQTGKELWRTPRDERTSWATPLVVEHAGKTQVIVSATGRVRGYDAANGSVLWECGGMTENVIPSPVFADGTVYLMSGFRGNALLAIRLDKAKGDITGSKEAVVWRHGKYTPYVPSPLLYRGSLYFVDSNRERLSCFDAKTGAAHFGPADMEGVKGVYASPLGAAGRVYVAGRNGVTAVLKHGAKIEVLAVNMLNTSIDASPAAVGKELYLRGSSHLYCIAAE